MKQDVRIDAERLLARICVGAQVSGVRFANSFIILFEHFRVPRKISYDDIYLQVETRWAICSVDPDALIDAEHLPELTLKEKLSRLAELDGQLITGIELDNTSPHLSVRFESGATLLVNGSDEQYESWELGITGSNQTYLVVATPGGELAVWEPEGPPSPTS